MNYVDRRFCVVSCHLNFLFCILGNYVERVGLCFTHFPISRFDSHGPLALLWMMMDLDIPCLLPVI